MEIIATTINKGGTGKTTTSITLSAGLAQHGARVLTVDLDPQGHIALALNLDNETGVDQPLLVPKAIKLKDVIIPTGRTNWDIAPANSELSVARDVLATRQRYEVLRDLLHAVRHDYDFAVLDCSPSYDSLYRSALLAADTLIIPVKADFMSSLGVNDALVNMAEARQHNPDLSRVIILPTFVQDGKLAQDIMDLLETYFSGYLAEGIRQCAYIAKAPRFGKTIWEYRPTARSAEDYQKLVQRWQT